MKIELINYQNLKFDKNLKLLSEKLCTIFLFRGKKSKKLILKEVTQKLLKFRNFRVENGTDPKLL